MLALSTAPCRHPHSRSRLRGEPTPLHCTVQIAALREVQADTTNAQSEGTVHMPPGSVAAGARSRAVLCFGATRARR